MTFGKINTNCNDAREGLIDTMSGVYSLPNVSRSSSFFNNYQGNIMYTLGGGHYENLHNSKVNLHQSLFDTFKCVRNFVRYLVSRGLSPLTINQYKRYTDKFNLWLASKNKTYENADRYDVREFLTYYKNSGIVNKTLFNCAVAIHKFYRYLNRGIFHRNYWQIYNMGCPRYGTPLANFLTEKEIKKLFAGINRLLIRKIK